MGRDEALPDEVDREEELSFEAEAEISSSLSSGWGVLCKVCEWVEYTGSGAERVEESERLDSGCVVSPQEVNIIRAMSSASFCIPFISCSLEDRFTNLVYHFQAVNSIPRGI